jgi:hypothetical protein
MRQYVLILAVVALMIGGVGQVRADMITIPFTMNVSPASTLTPGDNLFTVSLSQFNPALGTLTEVDFSLQGPATWTSTSTSPQIITWAYIGENITGTLVTDPSSFTSVLEQFALVPPLPPSAPWIGTGSVMTGLNVEDDSQTPFTDTFKTGTGGLTGTLTYDSTPSATAVPEPSTLTLLSLGSLSLLGYGWRRRKQVAA